MFLPRLTSKVKKKIFFSFGLTFENGFSILSVINERRDSLSEQIMNQIYILTAASGHSRVPICAPA